MISVQYFGQHMKKVYLIYFLICLALIPIRVGRIQIGMPSMPIPIRQNDADPEGTVPIYLSFKYHCPMGTMVGLK
jgi:hypothetical protein